MTDMAKPVAAPDTKPAPAATPAAAKPATAEDKPAAKSAAAKPEHAEHEEAKSQKRARHHAHEDDDTPRKRHRRHVRSSSAKCTHFRSYDADNGTYLGYDHRTHACR